MERVLPRESFETGRVRSCLSQAPSSVRIPRRPGKDQGGCWSGTGWVGVRCDRSRTASTASREYKSATFPLQMTRTRAQTP